MTIGIMSAMPEENSLLIEALQDKRAPHIEGDRIYHVGTLQGQRVVLAFSRWGKVAAATTTTCMIKEFGVSEMIFTGVAGGLAAECRVGDIVVANSLIQHDLDPSPLYPQFEIPLLAISRLEIQPVMLDRLTGCCAKLIESKLHNHIEEQDLNLFEMKSPSIHTGLVVSGDQFISDSEAARRIQSQLPDALCVEMEGAAMAQVCYEYKVPFGIVRVISDNANEDAHIDFPLFIDRVASKINSMIIHRYLDAID
jgi:adenosylhomocysteine nucleosidase